MLGAIKKKKKPVVNVCHFKDLQPAWQEVGH